MRAATNERARRSAPVLTAVALLVGCGGEVAPEDNAEAAIALARDAAVDTVAKLGLGSAVVTGDPTARPCLDGVGAETDGRSADYAVGLPTGVLDDAALTSFTAALDDPPLEDSITDGGGGDPDYRVVVISEERNETLVTVRIRLDAERNGDLSVLVDCVGPGE